MSPLRRGALMRFGMKGIGEIKINKTLHFVEEPVEIMDREVKTLNCSKIPIVKVCWSSGRGPEFTWEREDHMKARIAYGVYLLIFVSYLFIGFFLNAVEFLSYACSDSLLLTTLCCDDIHEVTPRVSALAGCDMRLAVGRDGGVLIT
ncbi:hypothetical protein Tco_0080071 [Tanacetum coccineum]